MSFVAKAIRLTYKTQTMAHNPDYRLKLATGPSQDSWLFLYKKERIMSNQSDNVIFVEGKNNGDTVYQFNNYQLLLQESAKGYLPCLKIITRKLRIK